MKVESVGKKTSNNRFLIVPFYNESQRLNSIYFTELSNLLKDINVSLFFVNDGSTDNSYDIVKSFRNNFSNFFIMDLRKNVGKSNAIRTAFVYLIENYKAEHVGYVDCDGAFDSKEISDLFSRHILDCNNITIGSRIMLAGTNIDRKLSRHITGRAIATFLNLINLPVKIYDPQTGLKIFKNFDELNIALKKEFRTRWFGDVELFSRLEVVIFEGLIEIPVRNWKDVRGSKLNFLSIFRVINDLLKLEKKFRLSLRN